MWAPQLRSHCVRRVEGVLVCLGLAIGHLVVSVVIYFSLIFALFVM